MPQDASSRHQSHPQSSDPNFQHILGKHTTAIPQTKQIPKIAHFVYNDAKQLSWLERAAIRAAIVNLEVETVSIWLPEELKLEGQIWNWILEMPEVWLRRIAMPTIV